MLKTFNVRYMIGSRSIPTQVCARNKAHLKDVLDERQMGETIQDDFWATPSFARDAAKMASDLLHEGKAAAANHALIWTGMVAARSCQDGWRLLNDDSPIHKLCHYMHTVEMRGPNGRVGMEDEKDHLVALLERFERSVPGISPFADEMPRYQIGAVKNISMGYPPEPSVAFHPALKPPSDRELEWTLERVRREVELETSKFEQMIPRIWGKDLGDAALVNAYAMILKSPYPILRGVEPIYLDGGQPHINEPERTRALRQVEFGHKTKMENARKIAAKMKAIHAKKQAALAAQPATATIGGRTMAIKDFAISLDRASNAMRDMSVSLEGTVTATTRLSIGDIDKVLRKVEEKTFGINPSPTGRLPAPYFRALDIPRMADKEKPLSIHGRLYSNPAVADALMEIARDIAREDRALTVFGRDTMKALLRQQAETMAGMVTGRTSHQITNLG